MRWRHGGEVETRWLCEVETRCVGGGDTVVVGV